MLFSGSGEFLCFCFFLLIFVLFLCLLNKLYYTNRFFKNAGGNFCLSLWNDQNMCTIISL